MTVLRASVLGGVDGVITSFAVVAGASAGDLSRRVVGIVGASSVLADGLSMGISEYLSSSAADAAEPSSVATSPRVLGVVCFTSFVVCGAVPLVVYVASESLLSCAMFSLVSLMLLGGARTRATGEPLLHGLGQTAVLGTVAGGVAYAVGRAAAAV